MKPQIYLATSCRGPDPQVGNPWTKHHKTVVALAVKVKQSWYFFFFLLLPLSFSRAWMATFYSQDVRNFHLFLFLFKTTNHPNLTPRLLVSNETLIRAGSYRLLLQSTLTLWRPVALQDRGQKISPRGVKPSGWRVAVYNAGFSPFHALILSIVPELSQLHIYRASKDHVTLPHPPVCRTPCFLHLHPLLLWSFPTFLPHILSTLSGVQPHFYLSPPSLFVSIAPLLLLISDFSPMINRGSFVPGQILSVPGVDCCDCGNHHDGWRTFPLTLCFDSRQTTRGVYVVDNASSFVWWRNIMKRVSAQRPILWCWKSDLKLKRSPALST